MWLWLWLAAIALIGPLAWEYPYAMGAALKKNKNKNKRKKLTTWHLTQCRHSNTGLLVLSEFSLSQQTQQFLRVCFEV